MNRSRSPIEERFWDKVDIPPDPDGCWEWNAATRNGYGVIGRPGLPTVEYAHRWIFQKFHGPLDDGKEVCHSCNNRLCVNFTHLYQGTRSDNMKQCWRDGRAVIPNRWKPGTFHQRAK